MARWIPSSTASGSGAVSRIPKQVTRSKLRSGSDSAIGSATSNRARSPYWRCAARTASAEESTPTTGSEPAELRAAVPAPSRQPTSRAARPSATCVAHT